MKYLISILAVLAMLLPAADMAARKKQAQITFAGQTHDFGKIAEDGGKVSHRFEFTNTGNANLVILDATADCGCTVPEYPTAPIAPGKKGVINVTYNPLYRPGSFTKVVTVRTNSKQKKVRVKITGIVTPRKK